MSSLSINVSPAWKIEVPPPSEAVKQRDPDGFKDQTDESNCTELHQVVPALVAFTRHLPSNPSLAEAKQLDNLSETTGNQGYQDTCRQSKSN